MLVDELRELRKSESPLYLRFLLNFDGSNQSLHLFFEGQQDESFYIGFIQQRMPDTIQVHRYRCGNKKAVQLLHRKVSSHKNAEFSAWFFVDKDLSDYLNEPAIEGSNVYQTAFYAIENYIASIEVAERVLREIFHLDDGDGRLAAMLLAFDRCMDRFASLLLPIMAWVAVLRSFGLRVNAEDIQCGKFIKIDDNLVPMRRGSREQLVAMLSNSRSVNPQMVVQRKFFVGMLRMMKRSSSYKLWLRGKYELWCMVEFFNVARRQLGAANGRAEHPVHTVIHKENAIEVLGPRARIPSCLEAFIHDGLARLNRL